MVMLSPGSFNVTAKLARVPHNKDVQPAAAVRS